MREEGVGGSWEDELERVGDAKGQGNLRAKGKL